jgi:hypothetical protein
VDVILKRATALLVRIFAAQCGRGWEKAFQVLPQRLFSQTGYFDLRRTSERLEANWIRTPEKAGGFW